MRDLKEDQVALNSPTIFWMLYLLSVCLFLVLFPQAIGAAQKIGRAPVIYIYRKKNGNADQRSRAETFFGLVG